MKLSYDPAANVAFIRFCDNQGDVETIRLTGDFLVDIDATGAVCGVELLNAREQLDKEKADRNVHQPGEVEIPQAAFLNALKVDG